MIKISKKTAYFKRCKTSAREYENAFKIYLNDIGLLRRMSNLDSKIIAEGNKLFEEFKGAFTENYVLNMLNATYENVPNYYTFDRNEIDFIIQSKKENEKEEREELKRNIRGKN